jgi:EpsD family peptidyl-prolyl cis-trans isomerase
MNKMKNYPASLNNTRVFSTLNKHVILSIALLFITSCSDADNEKPAATQIVAKVNDDEISVHQLNNSMAQMPQIAPENLANVRMDLVGKLVNEQLAVQQAISLKLDRSSEVMMQIEAARREILTKAYLKQLVSALPKPSTEDAQKFYDAHPELFAERRIFNLQQITIPSPHPPVAEIKKLTSDKNMTDIVTALKENKIVFTAGAATRAAEQIPLTTLTTITKTEEGQINIIESPQAITIVRVEASQLAPLPQESALQRIPQFLMNDQAKLAINEKLTQLKASSKIVYMNEFSDAAKSVATLPAPSSKPAPVNDSVEKGIAGI